MALSRRAVIGGAAAGGGLLVAFALLPRRYQASLAAGTGEAPFNSWLRIGVDAVVTVAVPQLEMGQGVSTLLAQIVATELGADWRQVAVEPVPPGGAYANLPLAAHWAQLWRPTDLLVGLTDAADDLLLRRWAGSQAFTVTAEGTALPAYEAACRHAAASARAMLAMAAAQRWDTQWQVLDAQDGFIIHPDRPNRRLDFGSLTLEAAAFDPPDPPPLRPDAGFRLDPVSQFDLDPHLDRWNEPDPLPALAAGREAEADAVSDADRTADPDSPDTTDANEPVADHAASEPPDGTEPASPTNPRPFIVRRSSNAVRPARTAFPRLDLPAKVDGSAVFAGDVRLPGMLYAAIRHGPKGQAELTHLDPDAAATQRGLIGIVRAKRFVAALGETWWAADQALERLAPRFSVGNVVEHVGIDAALERAIAFGSQQRILERGGRVDPEHRLSFVRRYDALPALHAPLETATATARFDDGRLELWIAVQAPEQARRAAAAALGLSAADVVLYPMQAGGSFDARLQHDHAIEVAIIAREAAQKHGRPVQLVWSRWQELLASHPRAPVAAVLGASSAPDGRIAALRARVACPPTMREFGERLFSNATSWTAIEATHDQSDPLTIDAFAPPYMIERLAVDHVPVRLTLPTARMRGGGHGLACFMTESFIDELAQEGGFEPVSFRIAMLGGDTRLVACLQQVARLASWDGGARGSGQGLACAAMPAIGTVEDEIHDQTGRTGARIAVIAEAAAGERGPVIRRLFATADIGSIINRDIARQQIEGGLIYGLGLALGSATRYEAGLPSARRLADLDLPTLADCPEVVLSFIESGSPSQDPGEIGMVAVAPALANALHALTGRRFRRLPLLGAAR